MSNEFRGTGNVGDQPVLRTAMVSGNPRQVTELRVFFDEYRQDGAGGLERRQSDSRLGRIHAGFVSVLASDANRHGSGLDCGMGRA